MRNRAKCKLCGSIIESYHLHDYVTCGCGEISITGGLVELDCAARSWDNFLRVDDNDNVVVPRVVNLRLDDRDNIKVTSIVNKDDNQNEQENSNLEPKSNRMSKSELMDTLDEMIKCIEELPQEAKLTAITHYDFSSLLMLLRSILRSDCIASNCDSRADA
jgi:hypothetical protein